MTPLDAAIARHPSRRARRVDARLEPVNLARAALNGALDDDWYTAAEAISLAQQHLRAAASATAISIVRAQAAHKPALGVVQ